MSLAATAVQPKTITVPTAPSIAARAVSVPSSGCGPIGMRSWRDSAPRYWRAEFFWRIAVPWPGVAEAADGRMDFNKIMGEKWLHCALDDRNR